MSLRLRWNAQLRQLAISDELLKQLHYPPALIAERISDGLVLYQPNDPRAVGKPRKVSYQKRAMPRLSIGEQPAVELGLRDGSYEAWVEERAIYGRWMD
jgi:hypothetical protein